MHNGPNHSEWRLLCLATLGIAGLTAVFLLSRTDQKPHETIGFAEFRLGGAGPSVRLNLPPGYRATYAREHEDTEAGVEDPLTGRRFYVTARLVPLTRGPESETQLKTFARENSLADSADYLDVSANFRTTGRDLIWCQRYTEVFRDSNRAVQVLGPGKPLDRLTVLRYAEEWQALVVELEFYMQRDYEAELEPLVWGAIQGMELTDRAGR